MASEDASTEGQAVPLIQTRGGVLGEMGQDNEKTLPSGLPDMADAPFNAVAACIKTVALTFMPLAIGFGIALGVWHSGNKSQYAANYGKMMSPEGHYLLFSVVVLGRTVAFLNNYPMIFWKARCMSSKSGNLRSNMMIYKLIGDGAPSNAVVLESDGVVGAYNRSNRSLSHFVETSVMVAALLLLAGSIFPFPTFCLALLFSAGRILHQVGYTTGYGGHAAGFVLSNLLAGSTLEGLCVVAGMHGLGWI